MRIISCVFAFFYFNTLYLSYFNTDCETVASTLDYCVILEKGFLFSSLSLSGEERK